MIELHENFQYCLDEYNPSGKAEKLTAEQITRLEMLLPQPIMDFLKVHGFESFHNGLFQMCDPQIMRPLLAMIFKGDKDFHHRDCLVIGYTAFGQLICWSNILDDFYIFLPENTVYSRRLARPDAVVKASKDHIASGIIPDAEDVDFLDIMGNPMYEACQKAHGKLESGECYGFFPALAISGVFGPFRRVENIKRVKALEHFSILAQMDTFYLVHLASEGYVPVRPIG